MNNHCQEVVEHLLELSQFLQCKNQEIIITPSINAQNVCVVQKTALKNKYQKPNTKKNTRNPLENSLFSINL